MLEFGIDGCITSYYIYLIHVSVNHILKGWSAIKKNSILKNTNFSFPIKLIDQSYKFDKISEIWSDELAKFLLDFKSMKL